LEIFDQDIADLKRMIETKKDQGRRVRLLTDDDNNLQLSDFQTISAAAIVLSEDMWLELGNPKTASIAPALVTKRLDLVNDGEITLIGHDIPEVEGSLAFAQVLLIASPDLQDEDYRRINSLQYELELDGYMIKAVPSSLTIWSRISRTSARKGFSFQVLGQTLINMYRAQFKISSMEVLFVTSSQEDVEELNELRHKVIRILGAMNKMMEEMSFDCSSCEYLDVCGDVRKLGAMRERLIKQRQKESA
jgi:CO dehydrogenase/acetyl-CoA synthase beta subunit